MIEDQEANHNLKINNINTSLNNSNSNSLRDKDQIVSAITKIIKYVNRTILYKELSRKIKIIECLAWLNWRVYKSKLN